MPPGMTYLPLASITVSTVPARSKPSKVEPGASTAAIVSPSISTSACAVPVALTTVPPWMSVVVIDRPLSSSRARDGGVGLRPAVPVELPGVAPLPDQVEVEVADDDLLVLAAAHGSDEVALRVDELARAVEGDRQFAVLVVLGAHPVGCGDEVAVCGCGRRLFDLPQPVGEARLGGVGVEDDLGAVQSQLPPALREVPVVADVDPDRPDSCPEDRVAQIAGTEVELLPELVQVGDVVLAVLAQHGPVRVHHHRGVVVDAG